MLAVAALIALASASQPFPYLDDLRRQERSVEEHPDPGQQRDFALMMLA